MTNRQMTTPQQAEQGRCLVRNAVPGQCNAIESMGDKHSELEKCLLNDLQHDFPISPRPYAELAQRYGVSEAKILHAFDKLQAAGSVSRIGAVFRPRRIGASTLAAMAVPTARLHAVAQIVNSYAAVNHNYEREHEINLWFVATAPDSQALETVIVEIERRTQLTVLRLPLLEEYHIDLGFPIRWDRQQTQRGSDT